MVGIGRRGVVVEDSSERAEGVENKLGVEGNCLSSLRPGAVVVVLRRAAPNTLVYIHVIIIKKIGEELSLAGVRAFPTCRAASMDVSNWRTTIGRRRGGSNGCTQMEL